MSFNKYTSDYAHDEHNVITQPGKFENEHVIVPILWDLALSGCGEDYYDGETPVSFFEFDQDDRDQFPEITEYGIALYEDSNGFVNAVWYDTVEEYGGAQECLAADGHDSEDEDGEEEYCHEHGLVVVTNDGDVSRCPICQHATSTTPEEAERYHNQENEEE